MPFLLCMIVSAAMNRDLSNNAITGSVPSSIQKMRSLQVLFVSGFPFASFFVRPTLPFFCGCVRALPQGSLPE